MSAKVLCFSANADRFGTQDGILDVKPARSHNLALHHKKLKCGGVGPEYMAEGCAAAVGR